MGTIDCERTDCAYYERESFADKCRDCSENKNSNPETAIFHYEEYDFCGEEYETFNNPDV